MRNKTEVGTFETCGKCENFLEEGQEQCTACGSPTRFMSFKTRAEYEVEQWRRHKTSAPAAS